MQKSAAQPLKVPVTLHALVQRLKRRHARDGETFHVTREHARDNIGLWHTVADNVVRDWWQNVESLATHARDVGVLGAHEVVA
jgi:hypothetical protein